MRLFALILLVVAVVGCGEKAPETAAPVTPDQKLPAGAGGQQLSPTQTQ